MCAKKSRCSGGSGRTSPSSKRLRESSTNCAPEQTRSRGVAHEARRIAARRRVTRFMFDDTDETRPRISEQPIEPAHDAAKLRDAPNREQRPLQVRLRARAAFVADRQAFVFAAEEDFDADGVAGKADGVHL